MKRSLILICFIGALWHASSLSAQLAMGQWRTHFSYNNIYQIAQSPNKVYAVSNGAMFSINKQDGEIEFYSKLTGLSDASVAQIHYSHDHRCLLIVYDNSNMDVMYADEIVNIPDLYNKQMTSSKKVNAIHVHADKAYLACDFGVLIVNVSKNEIAETCYIGDGATPQRVIDLTVYNDSIYAITESEMYVAAVNNPNIVNYEFWHKAALPTTGILNRVVRFTDHLLLMQNNRIYRRDSYQQWTPIEDAYQFHALSVSDAHFYALASNYVFTFNADYSYSVLELVPVYSVLPDERTGLWWMSGVERGVLAFNPADTTLRSYRPTGPAVNTPYRMCFEQGRLFVTQGGRWRVQFDRHGHIMIYEDGQWTNILNTDMRDPSTGLGSLDLMSIVVDPKDKHHFFATSYGMGLYEFREDKFYQHHTCENSAIPTIFPSMSLEVRNRYMRTDGLCYDAMGNLWVVSAEVDNALNILGADGQWHSLSYGTVLNHTTLGTILIPNERMPNQKWLLSHRVTPGIVFFDDRSTPYDKSDDYAVYKSNFIDQDGNSLNPSEYYCMTVDADGAVWVGTNEGPLVFPNPTRTFGTNECTRIKIPRNDGTNAADFLLSNEIINVIMVDGANRKWIGTTSSGLYLMSADGKTTLQHFTTQNSPLLSNQVLSLAMNPATGEVFVGTAAGLMSYQSDAADGAEDFSTISVYPNPVREDFTGTITIKGLMENTLVKITDLSGNVVCETYSNGGLAVWDGCDKWGRRVGTGVYFVICVTADGQEKGRTKILFIQ